MKDCLRAVKKFREYWLLAKDSEVAGYQKYWISLLGDVLGLEDALSRISFQIPVPTGRTTKFLDAWIPETKVLIEHKKRGVKLDQPQSGHDGMTPYEQALEYDNARGYEDKARWIVTCNFDEIWIYDRSQTPTDGNSAGNDLLETGNIGTGNTTTLATLKNLCVFAPLR